MAKLHRSEACNILARIHIPTGEDFHALSSTQVDRLVDAARAAKYRKPKHANGSTARYFHARLVRACR